MKLQAGNKRKTFSYTRSIKTKLSIVIVAAVGVSAFMSQLGVTLGWPIWIRPVVAGVIALSMARFLARGMTKPLREMVLVTAKMAKGDHSMRLNIARRDEVGQLATAFDAMAEELAETDRLQKEFVANASHELRTPVAALRSTLENLVDGVDQPNRSTLQQILGQAENLSNLVGQLLDLSRLDASAQPTKETEPVDIGDLLHRVVDEVILVNPDVQIAVRSPLNLLVDAEPHRLGQVFRNIIGNASRFSSAGNTVHVVATQSNLRVRISVRDTGPGIAEADRERIFERFWQADGVSRLAGSGAGLGLAISKQIVENHNGTIEISSNASQGACVVVDLPKGKLLRYTSLPTSAAPSLMLKSSA